MWCIHVCMRTSVHAFTHACVCVCVCLEGERQVSNLILTSCQQNLFVFVMYVALKKDFLQTSHPVLSCLIKKYSFEPFVYFWIHQISMVLLLFCFYPSFLSSLERGIPPSLIIPQITVLFFVSVLFLFVLPIWYANKGFPPYEK